MDSGDIAPVIIVGAVVAALTLITVVAMISSRMENESAIKNGLQQCIVQGYKVWQKECK